MSASPLVLTQSANAVATLTMNRPERRNALTLAMYTALTQALLAADSDASINAIVLTGANGYFTAGNDLSDFVGYTRGGEFEALTFLETIAALKKPLIAAVERGAVGIGVTMLQHCDFAYAGKSARFALPFVNFGLCTEGGASRILAHGPAARDAARWIYLGEPFMADDAHRAGLLTAVCDDDTTLAAAHATATKLAAMLPDAVQTTKKLIRASRPNMIETIREEVLDFTRLLEGTHAQTAISGFINKSR